MSEPKDWSWDGKYVGSAWIKRKDGPWQLFEGDFVEGICHLKPSKKRRIAIN